MANKHIHELARVRAAEAGPEALIPLSVNGGTTTITISDLLAQAMPPEVIVKCAGCGQWGAVKTPCRHCGAPIDPKE